MPMTIADARRTFLRTPIYRQENPLNPKGLPPPTAPDAPGGGGADEEEFDPTFGLSLPPGWVINPRTGALVPAMPPGNPGGPPPPQIGIGELFEAGGDLWQWNGRSITEASAAEAKDFYNGGSGGSGGGGGVDTGPAYLSLAQQKFGYEQSRDAVADQQWNRQFGLEETQSDRGELGNRAGIGLSTAGLARSLANDSFERARDPGNYPALLAGYAGLEGTAPTPLTTLLGQGFKVTPPEGGNPLADPRFKSLLDSLYGYGTVPDPAGVSAVRDAYRGGATDEGFRNLAEFDRARQMGDGGTMRTRGTKYLIDGATGEVEAVIGEEGPERIDVKPIRKFADGGRIDVRGPSMAPTYEGLTKDVFRPPSGSRWPALRSPSRFAALSAPPSAPVGAAPASPVAEPAPWQSAGPGELGPPPLEGEFTPAQGTAVSLGKSLARLGYPPEVVRSLLAGDVPGAPLFNPQVLEKMRARNPSLYRLAMAAITTRLGGAGLEDFMAESDRFGMAGLSSVGGVQR